jgi:hypothetical protein
MIEGRGERFRRCRRAQAGMAEMSQKFRDMGGKVYVEADTVKASNRVP